VVEVGVFERGLDVEQAGRDLHRQRRGGAAPPAASARRRAAARGHRLAVREQALERIADQRELLGRPLMRCISPPATADHDSLAADDALARLRDQRRVEAPEPLAE
jgi:hypothetical protein